jgi:hypothetical protein
MSMSDEPLGEDLELVAYAQDYARSSSCDEDAEPLIMDLCGSLAQRCEEVGHLRKMVSRLRAERKK